MSLRISWECAITRTASHVIFASRIASTVRFTSIGFGLELLPSVPSLLISNIFPPNSMTPSGSGAMNPSCRCRSRSPLIPVTSAIFARSCACFSVMVYFSEKRSGFKPGRPGCRSVWLPALAAFSKVEQISITAICPAVVSRMAGRDAS